MPGTLLPCLCLFAYAKMVVLVQYSTLSSYTLLMPLIPRPLTYAKTVVLIPYSTPRTRSRIVPLYTSTLVACMSKSAQELGETRKLACLHKRRRGWGVVPQKRNKHCRLTDPSISSGSLAALASRMGRYGCSPAHDMVRHMGRY